MGETTASVGKSFSSIFSTMAEAEYNSMETASVNMEEMNVSNEDLLGINVTTVAMESTTMCRNEYCVSEEQYMDMILAYIKPTIFERCIIVAYIIVFIVGLVGNFLVCFAVWKNHSMRTVTNCFIVNLAVADFLVILICLPPTLLSDVTETWYMGSVMCKIVKYFQIVSVGVSVLTLSAISVERWYAICRPLKFKATPTRAKHIVSVIWVVSMAIPLPELIVLNTHHRFPIEFTIFLTSCKPTWSHRYQAAYQFCLIVAMYVLPFLLMFGTYIQIAKSLWRTSIPSETSRDFLHPSGNSNTEALLHTRRNVAKMLMAVVIMFGICYLPVHLLNILRYTGLMDGLQALATQIALSSHFLCYFNSAINPVIYSFMSAKFRKEFMAACCCCKQSWSRGVNVQTVGNRQYIYKYRYHAAAGTRDQGLHHVTNTDLDGSAARNINIRSHNRSRAMRIPAVTQHPAQKVSNIFHTNHDKAGNGYCLQNKLGTRNHCLKRAEAMEISSSSASEVSHGSKGVLFRKT